VIESTWHSDSTGTSSGATDQARAALAAREFKLEHILEVKLLDKECSELCISGGDLIQKLMPFSQALLVS
jgi:hypothetical protein